MRLNARLTILVALTAVAAVAFAQPRIKPPDACEQEKKMPETYDIKTFLTPDWEIAMHEVFTHYLQAASTFGQGDYDKTIAFLEIMEFYVKMLPPLVPDKTPPPESKTIDKVEFRKAIEQLRKSTIELRRAVETKDYKKATAMAPDIVTKLCADCHKKAKIPPKWQMGGYKLE